MFKCNKCNSIDNFGLVLNPSYKGEGVVSKTMNEHEEIVFNVDGYEFIPDLGFMNSHAVCKYCGAIKCWEYFYQKFYKN